MRNNILSAGYTLDKNIAVSPKIFLDLRQFLCTFAPENQSGQIWLLATTSKNAKTAPPASFIPATGTKRMREVISPQSPTYEDLDF